MDQVILLHFYVQCMQRNTKISYRNLLDLRVFLMQEICGLSLATGDIIGFCDADDFWKLMQ